MKENLTLDQLKQNIDALTKQGAPRETVQNYIDTYQKNPDGTYGLKKTPEPSFGSKALGTLRELGGSLIKPAEDVVRTAVAPVVAGGKSLVKGTDFGTEYEQTLEKLKTAPSLSSVVSGGEVQATGRDLKDEKMKVVGDVLQSIPIVKGAKVALKTAQTVAPVAGKAAGVIAAGAVPGYMLDVGSSLSEGEDITEAITPGVGTAIGTAIPLAPYIIRGAGSIGKKTGEKISELVIPKSTQEAQILQAYKADKTLLSRIGDVLKGESLPPQGAYKTSVEKGLMGTKSMIGIQAKRASEKLWKDLIDPRLKSSGVKVDMPKFFETVKANIIKDNPDIGRQKVLLEALDAVKDDYKNVSEIDLSQLQKYKEGWAKFVPEKVYRGKPIAGAYNDVRDQLAGEARQTIYSTLGDDVKQAYFDYGNLKGLQEMGVTSMTGQKLKGGSFTGMAELLSQAVTPIGTIAGRAIYKLSNGMEIVGKAGAKTLEEAVGLTSKESQVLSQPINTQKSQTIQNQNNIMPNVSNIDSTIPQQSSVASKIGENFAMVPPIPTQVSKELQPLVETLDTLNPTGSIFAEYTPAMRAKMPLGKNITTYDKTAGLDANEIITIYRGTGKGNSIVAGDFVTTNKQLAKDYAGNGKVVEAKVKASDVLDDVTEPLGEEYIYRPKNFEKTSLNSVSKELQPVAEEARKYKSAEEFVDAVKKFDFKKVIGEEAFNKALARINADMPEPTAAGTKEYVIDLWYKANNKVKPKPKVTKPKILAPGEFDPEDIPF